MVGNNCKIGSNFLGNHNIFNILDIRVNEGMVRIIREGLHHFLYCMKVMFNLLRTIMSITAMSNKYTKPT